MEMTPYEQGRFDGEAFTAAQWESALDGLLPDGVWPSPTAVAAELRRLRPDGPRLGLASTRELLEELRARGRAQDEGALPDDLDGYMLMTHCGVLLHDLSDPALDYRAVRRESHRRTAEMVDAVYLSRSDPGPEPSDITLDEAYTLLAEYQNEVPRDDIAAAIKKVVDYRRERAVAPDIR